MCLAGALGPRHMPSRGHLIRLSSLHAHAMPSSALCWPSWEHDARASKVILNIFNILQTSLLAGHLPKTLSPTAGVACHAKSHSSKLNLSKWPPEIGGKRENNVHGTVHDLTAVAKET